MQKSRARAQFWAKSLIGPLVAGLICLLRPDPVRAEILGSSHDFSNQSWSGGEVCYACHTPDNADPSVIQAPLWNHQVTTATYSLYQSPTLQETPEQPRGISKLCLSCHDGTVAADSFGGQGGSHFIAGQALVGTDLRDNHPISIPWRHVFEPSPSSCFGCHRLHSGRMRYAGALPFPDGYVECVSCHDVHNTASTGNPKLLRLPTSSGSQLCQFCHFK